MIKKRTVIFGNYDTAAHGWTLTECTLSDPEQKLEYVEKPGGDGSWDMSTVLSDGIPRYKPRELKVVLECSKGSREERGQEISRMVNRLDGFEWHTILPDHPDHYLVGRLHVAKTFHKIPHSCVTVTATVETWFYSSREKVIEVTAATEKQTYIFENEGRQVVVPQLTCSGNIQLTYGDESIQLGTGTFVWPALLLRPGEHTITYAGTGTLQLRFREAVLE